MYQQYAAVYSVHAMSYSDKGKKRKDETCLDKVAILSNASEFHALRSFSEESEDVALESGGEGQRRRNETKGRLDSGDHRKEAVER